MITTEVRLSHFENYCLLNETRQKFKTQWMQIDDRIFREQISIMFSLTYSMLKFAF